MTASPIDWEAVQNALHAWVAAATEIPVGRVIWAYPEHPQPNRPFAWLSIIAGPRPLARPENRRTSQIMRDRITVAAAAVQTYEVRVFEADGEDEEGELYTYDAQLADDAEAIRDGLVLALAGSGLVIANDPDDVASLLIDGTAARPHFHTEVQPALSIVRETVREAVLETSYTPCEITVRVQVETDSQRPTEHARSYLARLHASLGLRSTRSILRDAHVAFFRAFPPLDLSPDQTSRMAQDFHFGVGAQADENVPWVRTATVTGTLCA